MPDVQEGMSVGPHADDTVADGVQRDLALEYFKADALVKGYDCKKKGCGPCCTFGDY